MHWFHFTIHTLEGILNLQLDSHSTLEGILNLLLDFGPLICPCAFIIILFVLLKTCTSAARNTIRTLTASSHIFLVAQTALAIIISITKFLLICYLHFGNTRSHLAPEQLGWSAFKVNGIIGMPCRNYIVGCGGDDRFFADKWPTKLFMSKFRGVVEKCCVSHNQVNYVLFTQHIWVHYILIPYEHLERELAHERGETTKLSQLLKVRLFLS